MCKRRGFSVSEILILFAVCALLVAVAVPGFVDAENRRNVSRAKADMRTIAVAMEAYASGNGVYPGCNTFGTCLSDSSDSGTSGIYLEHLTTPIAYITNLSIHDPFPVAFRYSPTTAANLYAGLPTAMSPSTDIIPRQGCFYYSAWNSHQRILAPPGTNNNSVPTTATAWVLQSAAPYRSLILLGGILANDDATQLPHTINMLYDPTNGSTSRGNIWRMGGTSPPTQFYKAGEGLRAAVGSTL